MTSVETYLKELAEFAGCSLYKYYNNDEDRDPKIPDVLDCIDDVLDNLDKDLVFYQKRLINSINNFYVPNYAGAIKEIKNDIKEMENIRATLEDERAKYYFVCPTKNMFMPVITITLPIKTPSVIDGKLVLTETGEAREVYICDDPSGRYVFPGIVPCEPEAGVHFYSIHCNNNIPFFITGKYVGFEEWVGDNHMEKAIFVKCKCPECNQIFAISKDEQDWYAKKGLQLPKRCKYHRKKNYAAMLIRSR